MRTFLVAFAASVLSAAFYPYVIYPLLLWAVTRRGLKAPAAQPETVPTLSLLVALHNEAQNVLPKVRNFLESDYDRSKAEMVLVSDGSDDGTDEVLRAISTPGIVSLFQPRSGKTAALNRAVARAGGEVLVFSDADTLFGKQTLQALAAPFRDPQVGLVTGRSVEGGEDSLEGRYAGFEARLLQMESHLGIVAGADGAVYALRRSLYEPLQPEIINDFHHPVLVSLQGYRSVFEPGARASEPGGRSHWQEFSRQRRMTAQAIYVFRRALVPLARRGRFVHLWLLISHKLLRWLHVPAVLSACLALAALGFGGDGNLIMIAVLPAYLVFVAVSLSSTVRLDAVPLFGPIVAFERVHLAYACGVLDALRGETYRTWQPRGG